MLINTLEDNNVCKVLDRLHKQARNDWWRFIGLGPGVIVGLAKGKSLMETVTPKMMKNFFIPVSPSVGKFIYLTAVSTQAKNIVEFGTSFGISTIYLASALQDNKGGLLIGTELEPSKQQKAVSNLKEAGLYQYTDIRQGDALETLKDVPDKIDMVFLDGWKDLYIPVVELLKSKLRPGAVILAEDILEFKKYMKPYVQYMQSRENGFESVTVPFASGVEYSCYMGGQK